MIKICKVKDILMIFHINKKVSKSCRGMGYIFLSLFYEAIFKIFIYSSPINRSEIAIVSTHVNYDLLCAENIKFCMLGEFQIQNTVYFSNVSSS